MVQNPMVHYLDSVLGLGQVLMPPQVGLSEGKFSNYDYDPQCQIVVFTSKSLSPAENNLLDKIIQATGKTEVSIVQVSLSKPVAWVSGPQFGIVFGEYVGQCIGLSEMQVGDIWEEQGVKLTLTHSVESMAQSASEKSKKALKAETWKHIKNLIH